MKKTSVLMMVIALLTGCNSIPYKEAEKNWKSHTDLAKWQSKNFYFDTFRQREVLKTMRAGGVGDVVLKSPKDVYKSGGYCADSANFSYQNLKKINPEYNPRFVFIENSEGRPHHWVTAFNYKGMLYIMDYGTGQKWSDMQGLHGPYKKLSGYEAYLSSLNISGFGVGSVYFRDFPGTATE